MSAETARSREAGLGDAFLEAGVLVECAEPTKKNARKRCFSACFVLLLFSTRETCVSLASPLGSDL